MRSEALVAMIAFGCVPHVPRGPIPVEQASAPVQVVRLQDDSAPNVYLQAVVRVGSAWDPPGQEGLAALTARAMVDAGAGERSGQEVRDALVPTGNAFQVVVDRELTSIRLRCHRDHRDLCTELFTDVIARPTFRPADVTRLAEQAAHAVGTGLLANEEALGEEVFHGVLYEAHPYGHPVRGRTGSLPLLDASDVKGFHDTRVLRSTVLVGLAGPIDAERERRIVDALGDGLRSSLPPELPLPPPNHPVGRGLIAVDTETGVTGFHLGHPLGVGRDHEDWVPLTVGITAFGAHRQSFGRLFRALRGERGLNYGDYAYAEPFVQRGWAPLPEQGVLRRDTHFLVWIRPTSVENGPFALKLAVDELERLAAEGLEPEELRRTVAYLQRHTALEATDPGRRLAYALDAAVTGTPNVLDMLPRALESITLGDVNAALAAHLRPDDLWIVAVSGDARGLTDRLLEGSPTPIVQPDDAPPDGPVGPGDPERAARDAEIATRSLGLDPTRVHIVPAEGVFR